jgi:acyl transferase domain-containing protein/NAD(P)-dependent dehydrogenase (short-subunit alcohol dehydrogenase family)/NAD(P)H-dependent flavin oxidoreductase YrpB (nitropropane dioxygenase family)
MNERTFLVCCLSPGPVPGASVALSACRSGGVGIIDVALCRDERERSQAAANLRELVKRAPAGANIGIRVSARQIELGEIRSILRDRAHWTVLADWQSAGCRDLAEWQSPRSLLWLEVTDPGQTHAAADLGTAFHGWAGRGSEAGGWTGTTSAFVMAQWLARQPRPFLIQGGIGMDSAAACRVAGAAGVMLDDQLLLHSSGFPPEWRETLRKLPAEDLVLAGEELGTPCRFAARAGMVAGRALAEIKTTDPSLWRSGAAKTLGWGDLAHSAWPVGQSIAFAPVWAEKHRTAGRSVRELRNSVEAIVEQASRLQPFSPGSALAAAHGTKYPIVQGPMTRVSDCAAFANAVAEAGALPMIAMALLRIPQSEELLESTSQRLGGQPWGVGILGFVPPDIREEQLACLRRVRPPVALISGGRPDQAAELEQDGIATYLHVPLRSLIRPYFEKGARRFVFEGSECGGHTGPLTSFSLWGQAVETLLAEIPSESLSELSVLFAGGIHDAVSAAMASVFATRLAARGVRTGMLMGTAYLFTREIVGSGAVTSEFQAQAVRCRRTARLVTGPGHLIRCAATPFVDEFQRVRSELTAANVPTAEISRMLEDLTLGRARAASKGLWRDTEGNLSQLDAPGQETRGMYMMGEVAALRASVISIGQLHLDVSEGASSLVIQSAETSRPVAEPAAPSEPVAIVGMSCLLPKAQTPGRFWRNMLDQTGVIGEVPAHRFDWRLYYDENPRAEDKAYSKWGGFLSEIPFDPVSFGIPPRSLKSISATQLLALEAARQALDDAGYHAGDFDREHTSVILGLSGTGDLEEFYIARSSLPVCVAEAGDEVRDRLPQWTEESFPGILANVVAGRVSNRLDLGGMNLVVDAACASSLAALQIAVADLQSGRSSVAITGGIDLDQTPHTFIAFSKTRALSPKGQARPFDRNADGIVLSEGAAVFVLKRLADAERDGDRIYALIRSVEGSSDGKALGLTAPRSEGQQRALTRAYRRAGVDPASIGFYEAHATGTAVGDRTELETIGAILREAHATPRGCAIGSAKGLLGHTKAAAGAVGLMKAALALRHRTLPPQGGVREPLEPLLDTQSPLACYDRPTPWLDGPAPRRAGVSAFGFGGTNFHAVLEEYAAPGGPSGAADWPAELLVFAAAGPSSLAAELEQLRQASAGRPSVPLRDFAFSCALAASDRRHEPLRAAIVAQNAASLDEALTKAIGLLSEGQTAAAGPDVFLAHESECVGGGVAFLFPGQGSQYPGMGREFAVYLDEVRRSFDLGDRAVNVGGPRLSLLILPPAAFTPAEAERQTKQLAATDVAQPAIGVLTCGLLDFALRVGLRASRVAGHSYGEYIALHAAGAIGREALLHLSTVRGKVMREAAAAASGAMAAVQLPADEVVRRIDLDGHITIANFNEPNQCVLSGAAAAIDEAVAVFRTQGAKATKLNVSAAFHSPHMAGAAGALARAIDEAPFAVPAIPVHANYDGEPYPDDLALLRRRLADHLCNPVRFEQQIRRLYDAGVRVFVEIGPKEALTGLVDATLQSEPRLAVALDRPGAGMRGLLGALGHLYTARVPLDVAALFVNRPVFAVDAQPRDAQSRAEWFLHGGGIRHKSEPQASVGAKPFLNADTAAELAARSGVVAGSGSAKPGVLSLYRDYQETMRGFLASQERVLMEMLDRAEGMPVPRARAAAAAAPATAIAAPAPAPAVLPAAARPFPPEAPPVTEELTRDGLAALVLAVASDRTGYPTTLLNPDYDIEAELGIDSLKRTEMLLELERRLPEKMAQQLRPRMDSISQVKTLRMLGDALWGAASPLAEVDACPVESAAERKLALCPRYVMRAHEKHLPQLTRIPARGLFLVTEDLIGAAPLAAALLRSRGADAMTIKRAELETPAALAERVATLRMVHGPVRAVLHLAPLALTPRPENLKAWRADMQVETHSLFQILQTSIEDLVGAEGGLRAIAAATLMGGQWGRSLAEAGGTLSCGGAGAHGLLRTVAHEFETVRARVVDFSVSLGPERMAECMVSELLSGNEDTEVGWDEQRRIVFSPAPAPRAGGLPWNDWRPREGSVILITGGGRGIAARVAQDLAAPGVRLAIVGRGELGTDDCPTGTSPEAIRALREEMIARAVAKQQSLKPAALEARLNRKLQQRERTANVRRLRELGAEVIYESVDVRDEEKFPAFIHSLYERFGHIDGVIHAAGVIDDRLLKDKSRQSFDLVFDTKVDGAFLLGQALRPESLRWMALFASVSGRFGNPGQCDYAAANEVLTRWAWQAARQWPGTRVVCCCWGPWENMGMAADGVDTALRQRGMDPIPPGDACRFLWDELTFGSRDDCEVIAGAGPWSKGG